MAKTPEGITKNEIKGLLDSYGDKLYYFMPVQMGYGRRTVDFLICFRGLFIAIEAKRRGAGARKFQLRLLDQVRGAGGTARCIDWVQELRELLRFIEMHPIDRVIDTLQRLG